MLLFESRTVGKNLMNFKSWKYMSLFSGALVLTIALHQPQTKAVTTPIHSPFNGEMPLVGYIVETQELKILEE
ncbi:MAG: hypothetical protein ACRCXZ_02720 [Patescibacteria group bacterium]